MNKISLLLLLSLPLNVVAMDSNTDVQAEADKILKDMQTNSDNSKTNVPARPRSPEQQEAIRKGLAEADNILAGLEQSTTILVAAASEKKEVKQEENSGTVVKHDVENPGVPAFAQSNRDTISITDPNFFTAPAPVDLTSKVDGLDLSSLDQAGSSAHSSVNENMTRLDEVGSGNASAVNLNEIEIEIPAPVDAGPEGIIDLDASDVPAPRASMDFSSQNLELAKNAVQPTTINVTMDEK